MNTIRMSAECNFLFQPDGFYVCSVKSLVVTKPDTVITEFKSNPLIIKTLVIEKQNVQHFPKGLPCLFPNLEHLVIRRCGLKEIHASDLEGFTNLKILELDNNNLTRLPDDLFRHVPQLEKASFKNNRIKMPLLDPLRCNQEIDLSGNDTSMTKIVL